MGMRRSVSQTKVSDQASTFKVKTEDLRQKTKNGCKPPVSCPSVIKDKRECDAIKLQNSNAGSNCKSLQDSNAALKCKSRTTPRSGGAQHATEHVQEHKIPKSVIRRKRILPVKDVPNSSIHVKSIISNVQSKCILNELPKKAPLLQQEDEIRTFELKEDTRYSGAMQEVLVNESGNTKDKISKISTRKGQTRITRKSVKKNVVRASKTGAEQPFRPPESMNDTESIYSTRIQEWERYVDGNDSSDWDENTESVDVGQGLYLLRLAKLSQMSGDNPFNTLSYATRAAKFFNKYHMEENPLELISSLHVLAASYSGLHRHEDAVIVLEHSLSMIDVSRGPQYASAAFAGKMHLGDCYIKLGKQKQALGAYYEALDIQKKALGDLHPEVANTCRYLAEAHLQVMQFEEAEELCEHVLNTSVAADSSSGSKTEAADRRLMALILSGKGDHEMALEHLTLANIILISHNQLDDSACVESSIGDVYLALGRYDEAAISYRRSLNALKKIHGDTHPSVASMFVSLGELFVRMGKKREAKTCCQRALQIYGSHEACPTVNDLITGLSEVAFVYEAMHEQVHAVGLLQKALELLEKIPGEQNATICIETQIGVLYYEMQKFEESFLAFKNAVTRLRASTDRKTWLLGILLNQMGLACIELSEMADAVAFFEESKDILDVVCSQHHDDTLAVCSNLAAAYDAIGRVDDAIVLLKKMLELKEEKLGIVHPEVLNDRKRLLQLLKDVGRPFVRKTNTLAALLLQQPTECTRDRRIPM